MKGCSKSKIHEKLKNLFWDTDSVQRLRYVGGPWVCLWRKYRMVLGRMETQGKTQSELLAHVPFCSVLCVGAPSAAAKLCGVHDNAVESHP